MLALQTFYHWAFILKLSLIKLTNLALNSLYSPRRPGLCCPVASPSQVAGVIGLHYRVWLSFTLPWAETGAERSHLWWGSHLPGWAKGGFLRKHFRHRFRAWFGDKSSGSKHCGVSSFLSDRLSSSFQSNKTSAPWLRQAMTSKNS